MISVRRPDPASAETQPPPPQAATETRRPTLCARASSAAERRASRSTACAPIANRSSRGAEPPAAAGGSVLAADTVKMVEDVFSNTTPKIGELLLRDFVLAFEVASVLLLAAMVGALALVRER